MSRYTTILGICTYPPEARKHVLGHSSSTSRAKNMHTRCTHARTCIRLLFPAGYQERHRSRPTFTAFFCSIILYVLYCCTSTLDGDGCKTAAAPRLPRELVGIAAPPPFSPPPLTTMASRCSTRRNASPGCDYMHLYASLPPPNASTSLRLGPFKSFRCLEVQVR